MAFMSASGDLSSRPRKLIRAPLVPVALALIGGIVAGRFTDLPVGFWAVAGGAAFLAAIATFLRKRFHLLTGVCLAAAILSLGAVYVRLVCFSVRSDDIVHYAGEGRHLATVRGRIVTAPQIYGNDAGVAQGWRRPPRTSFLLGVEGILLRGKGVQPASGLARVTVQQPVDRLAAGQDVELVGWIGRVAPPNNPGQFDWQAAARNSGTLVQVTVPGADGVTVRGEAPGGWLGRAVWQVRSAARQHLLDCGDVQGGRLVNALILGERHPALLELNRAMVHGGVAHFLSISGLHLGVFLGFVYLLCRLASLTPRRAAGAVLIILAAYIVLAEPRAPLLRSALMAAALCLATIFQRRYAALNALAAAAIVLLAVDPMQLFSAGFQLSFAIVAGLLIGHGPFRRMLFGRWLRRRGLMVFRGERGVRKWLYFRAADWAMSGVTMCLTAYLAAAPLVAVHFGLFSPWAPLLSLVLFPVVLAVLVPGYVSIALAWPMPNLSYAFGRLAAQAADGLTRLVSATDHLPGLSFELRPLGPGWAVLCYAVLILLIARHRSRRIAIWAAVAVLAVAGVTWQTQRDAPPPAEAELHVLAVGDGQCALLRTPSGETFLLDAGTRSGFDGYEQVLRPLLRELRLPRPDAAFVSHANTDHFNMLATMVDRAGALQRIYLNEYFAAEPQPPVPVGELMSLLAEGGVEVVRLAAGQTVPLDDRTRVEVLWPPAQRRDDLSVNDTSLVLRVVCDGRSVLLTGDLDSTGQAELTRGGGVASDVLVLPHHGGWEKELPAFSDAVAPTFVLVSSGRPPRAPASGGEAARQFYRRIAADGRYFSTSRNGWIRLRFGASGIRVTTLR